jgi:hypothetical protein
MFMMSTTVLNSVIVSYEAAVQIALSAYAGEVCGICHKENGDYFWVNPKSRTAHSACVTLIKEAEEPLKAIISTHFPSKTNHLHANLSHCFAIEKISQKIGDETLSTYITKNGKDALKELFSTVGMQAVRDYYYAYCDN